MSSFLVLIQTTQNGRNWSDAGPIRIVESVSAREAAFDLAIDQAPEGENWRAIAWANQPGKRPATPDAEVRAGDLSISRPRHTNRAARRHHRPRTRGPVSAVVAKVRASGDLVGTHILVTDNPANAAGQPVPGNQWHPAREADGAAIAFVKRFAEIQGRKPLLVLETSAGTVKMTPGTTVIPANDKENH